MRKKTSFPCLFLVAGLACLFVNAVAGAEPPAFMGDWEGAYIDAPKGSYGADNPTIVAHVIGSKDGRFEVQFLNAFERRAYIDFQAEISPTDGELKYADKQWEFETDGDTLSGVRKTKKKNGETVEMPFELKKVERISPTMGRPAPAGADVLIGGNLDKWRHDQGKPPTWKLLPGGILEVYPMKDGNREGGALYTKKDYGDCEIHMEFKLPYEPGNSGQGRSNSGVFIQGNYEVQILDSYGLDSGWTDCGALYKWAPPKVNRCAPPEQWQTYDIKFRTARYDSSGELLQHPVITVLHNGRLIHNEEVMEEIPYNTEVRRKVPHPKDPGPIFLQDHGHPIQFRNFWVMEL